MSCITKNILLFPRKSRISAGLIDLVFDRLELHLALQFESSDLAPFSLTTYSYKIPTIHPPSLKKTTLEFGMYYIDILNSNA